MCSAHVPDKKKDSNHLLMLQAGVKGYLITTSMALLTVYNVDSKGLMIFKPGVHYEKADSAVPDNMTHDEFESLCCK